MIYEEVCPPHEISITIKGLNPISLYSIEIHAEKRENSLRLGTSEYEEALPFNLSFFFFDGYIKNNENLFYSVKIKAYNQIEHYLDNTTLTFMFKDKKNHSYPNVVWRGDNEIIIIFKAIEETYCIEVDNSNNSNHFFYKFELNVIEIESINNNREINSILAFGQSKNFYFTNEKFGNIIIEFFQCSEKSEFHAVINQENIIKQNISYDNPDIVENSRYSTRLMINSSDKYHVKELFIIVESLESKNNGSILRKEDNLNISSYILKIWSKPSKTPYEVFYPSDSGNIDFSSIIIVIIQFLQ